MKPTISLLSLFLTTLTTFTHAQSLADIPTCASTAALQSFTSTGCQLTDFPCICNDQSFLTSLLPVVEAACSPEDLQKTTAFTQKLCRDNGVTLNIPTGAASSASATATDGMAATSTMAAATASGSGGAGNGGNGTTGGRPTTPTPTPQAQPPNSGVGGMGGL
ncbi:MAG: hypothetical protein L6R39_005655, partial [Caloplaca ligustica]